jgi:hypothetical protein
MNMLVKFLRSVTTASLIVAPSLVGIPTQALAHGQEQEHQREHHPGNVQHPTLTLNKGKKWPTDVPLREGMSNIRRISQEAASKTTAADHQLAASHMNEEIQKIFKNCKLPPKAHAMLHIILADIISDIETLKDPKGNTNEAYADISRALVLYGQYFDHLGWPVASGS